MKKTKRLLSLVIMLTMIIFNGSFLFVFAEGEEAPAPAAAAAEKTETPATNASDANPAVPSEEKVSGDSKNAAENDAQLSNTNEGDGVASKGGASTTDISSDAPVNDAGTKVADTDTKADAGSPAKASDSTTPTTGPDDPISVTITATKSWEGSGSTPESVLITLNQYSASSALKNTYNHTVTAADDWKYTFTIEDYAKGDTFKVSEMVVLGYETTITQEPSVTITAPKQLVKYPVGSSLIITVVDGKSIIVLKKGSQWAVWTPNQLTEAEMEIVRDTISENGYKIEELDLYEPEHGLEFYHGDVHAQFGFVVNVNEDGTAKQLIFDDHSKWSWIVYGIYEGLSVVDAAIKNTPTTIDISGTKTWVDDSNRDGKRPDSITVNLLADGEKVASKTVKGEGDTWSYTFEDVPEYTYDESGTAKKISYTVSEGDVADYTPSISGYNITNTHTPETIEVAGTKTWDDAGDQDGKRPESITVNLLADRKKIASKSVTGSGDTWEYSFGNLPKYKEGAVGQEIEYTVSEETIDGYEATIDGLNITNKHTPETVNVAVKKVWDDNNNADGKRPTSLNVTLSNGNSYSLTEVEGWTLSIDGLPKYKDGKEIEYSWTEEAVDGYKLSQIVEDKSEDTITTTLTNTVQPEVVPDEPTDDNDQTPDKTTGQTSDKPKTGDNGYAAEMLVFLVSLTALAVALYTRRWREDE